MLNPNHLNKILKGLLLNTFLNASTRIKSFLAAPDKIFNRSALTSRSSSLLSSFVNKAPNSCFSSSGVKGESIWKFEWSASAAFKLVESVTEAELQEKQL